MPNIPRFVYRIDTRSPEQIFQTGFQPVGNVRDFFTHILGERMRDSHFISTSETPTAALRFFASWLDEPIGRDRVYLYEIRANDHFYNARTTAENFLDRVLNNQITYEHGNRESALDCIDILRGDFAYQREWFSDGTISREQIVRAWMVDMVEIDPRHVRHTGREFSQALPRINDPEIINPSYQDQPTHANPNPWDNAPNIQTPSRVSIPEQVELADIAEGVSASMSFACPNPDSTNNRNKRDLNNNLQCIAQNFIEYKINEVPKYASSYKKMNIKPLYLATKDLKFKFKLSMDKRKTYTTIVDATHKEDKNEETKVIYDNNERLCKSINNYNKEIQLALTIQTSKEHVDILEIISEVSVINDTKQKWYLSPIDDINTMFRLSTRHLPDIKTGIFTKKNSNGFDQKLYAIPLDSSLKNEYEELFIVLGDEFNDISFPITSASQTQLIDIGMCWESNGYYYRPLVNGYSKQEKTKSYEIFYDLKSSKIIFISNSSKIYCLRNKLDPNLSAGWDWIEWKESDFSIQDDSTKWYFSRGNLDIPDVRGLNKRYIKSYKNNNFLKVIYSGSRWGSWYTTKHEKDNNSVMIFVVNETIDK